MATVRPERPARTAEVRPFGRLAGRARRAELGVVGVVALSAFAIATDAYGLYAVDQALAGATGSNDKLRASDTLDVLAGIGWLVAFLVAAVAFLVWFHRTIRNLPILGDGRERQSPAWAVGSWFVPIVSFFVPKRAANDAWLAGEVDADVPGFVHWWWAAWVLAGLVGNAVGRVWLDEPDELAGYRALYVVDAVSSALYIVAGVLAIRVIRSITERQETRAPGSPAGGS